MRLLSLISYPFLVKYYLKSDIAIFKSFQAITLILITIIPLGTDILYISTNKEKRENYWELFFWASFLIAFIISIIFMFNESFSSFLLKSEINYQKRILFAIFPLIEFLKVIYIIKFTSLMNFKEISTAIFVNKFILNFIIISSAFFFPTIEILILAVIISEILEMIILLIYSRRSKLKLFPKFNMNNLKIDSKSRKFIFFSGGDKLINSFAIQFPIIFLVIILGEELAPEFQLPLYAVSVPASLIMISFSKVLFPYFSNIQDNLKIKETLLSIEFIITLIVLPILICISFFSSEIVSLLFDRSWGNAILALKILPIAIFANVINNPFTHLAPIKRKPQINFLYSISLLTIKLLAIYLGYRFYGFIGVVIFYCFGEVLVRFLRLFIFDCKLIDLSGFELILHIKNNLIFSSVLGFSMFTLFALYNNKILSIAISISIFILLNFTFQKKKLFFLFHKIRDAIMA